MKKFYDEKKYKIGNKKYFYEVIALAKEENMQQEFAAKLFHDKADAKEYIRQAKKRAEEYGYEIVIFTAKKETTITAKI